MVLVERPIPVLPTCRRQKPDALVIADCLHRHASPLCNLSNTHLPPPANTQDLAPRGKVKSSAITDTVAATGRIVSDVAGGERPARSEHL